MSQRRRYALLVVVGGISVLLLFVFLLRPFLLGSEDLWICKDNKWITHGTPSYPKPGDFCGIKKPIPKTKDACLLAGGVWKKLGPDPFETCNIKASDRGTICTDNSECSGWCQSTLTRDQLREGMKGKIRKGRGQCSLWIVELGCFGMVEKGIIKTICIN